MTIYQVGLWLTRDPEKVRLVIEGGHSETASPQDWVEKAIAFLQKIGWPGDTERLSALLFKLGKVATSGVYLAVDVSSETGPKLGLESYVKAMTSVAAIESHQQEWIRFLDWLLAEGWVTPAKRQAHLEYIGMGEKVQLTSDRSTLAVAVCISVAVCVDSSSLKLKIAFPLLIFIRLRIKAFSKPRSTELRRATPLWSAR